MTRRGLLILLLATLTLSSGCLFRAPPQVAGRLKTVPVSGSITLDGSPVEGATVMFCAPNLKLTAYGKTDAAGAYQLTTYEQGDGAPVGHFKVTIRKQEHEVTGKSDHPALPPESRSLDRLPLKYAESETSGLAVDIAEGNPNTFDIELFSST